MLTLYRPCAYPGAGLRHASGATVPKIRNHSLLIKSSVQKVNQALSVKKPYLTTTLLWTCKLFLKSNSFSQTFVGRTVGTSRICRLKKVSESNGPRINHFPRNPHTLSVRQTCPLQEKIFAFSSVLTITIFWLKLQWKTFGRRATSKANPPITDRGWKVGTDCTETGRSTSSHSHGTENWSLEKQKGTLPGEEVTRRVCVLP